MLNIIEAVFDGAVFHPQQAVELEPNTRVEITVKVTDESSQKFRVKSFNLGVRPNLNYDKINELIEIGEATEE